MSVPDVSSTGLQRFLQEEESVGETGGARWHEPGGAARPGTLVATDRRLLHVSETGMPSSLRYDRVEDVRRRGGRLEVETISGDHASFEGERGFLRAVLAHVKKRIGAGDLVVGWTRLAYDSSTGVLVCDQCGFGMDRPYATCAWCARTVDPGASQDAVDAWVGRNRSGGDADVAVPSALEATGALVGSVTADRDGVTHVSGPRSRQWPWGEVDAYHVESHHDSDPGGTILMEFLTEHYRHTLHVVADDVEAWIVELESHGIPERFDHDPVALREAAAVHTAVDADEVHAPQEHVREGEAREGAAGEVGVSPDAARDEIAALNEIAATDLDEPASSLRGIGNPSWPEEAPGTARSSWPQPPPGRISP